VQTLNHAQSINLLPFTRWYWRLEVENSWFSPPFFDAPTRGNPLEFLDEKVIPQKLKGFGYRMVKILWSYLQPFLYDGRIDGVPARHFGLCCNSVGHSTVFTETNQLLSYLFALQPSSELLDTATRGFISRLKEAQHTCSNTPRESIQAWPCAAVLLHCYLCLGQMHAVQMPAFGEARWGRLQERRCHPIWWRAMKWRNCQSSKRLNLQDHVNSRLDLGHRLPVNIIRNTWTHAQQISNAFKAAFLILLHGHTVVWECCKDDRQSFNVTVCENCESGCIWSGTNNLAECCGDCEKGYMRNDNSFKCERNNNSAF